MPSLHELRQAIKHAQPQGDVERHGSEKHRLAQMLAQAYQDETEGKLYALQEQVGVWRRSKGFETNWKNTPEKLMLIVTELGEAMEAYRHLKSDFLGHIAEHKADTPIEWADPTQFLFLANFGEELADTVIRILDLADALAVDLQSTIAWKMAVNELRPRKHGKEC